MIHDNYNKKEEDIDYESLINQTTESVNATAEPTLVDTSKQDTVIVSNDEIAQKK